MRTAERVGEDPAAYVEDPPRSEDSEPGVKTVFFITHADEFDRTLGRVLSYEDGGGLRILRWNYCFQPFRAWGLYFEFAEGWTDGRFAGYLSRFREEGFRNLLYVDLTECDHGYSGR